MIANNISIARDFSRTPAGRFLVDGPFNGERFRDKILIPALKKAAIEGSVVRIEFDDADSYSSSFLEEVFGGMVRSKQIDKETIMNRLSLDYKNPIYKIFVDDARQYIERELSKIQSS